MLVDAGAAVRLRESGSSLLAVGVTGADGSFAPGDAVWVVERGIERPLGKGISEYSSNDVARTAGHRSAYVREHFPDAPEEVIGRTGALMAKSDDAASTNQDVVLPRDLLPGDYTLVVEVPPWKLDGKDFGHGGTMRAPLRLDPALAQ